MDSDTWRRVEDLLGDAMNRPPAERVDFVRRAAQGDPSLEREVLSLIAAAATDPDFLSQPLIDLAAGDVLAAGDPSAAGDVPVAGDLPAAPEQVRRIDRYRLVRLLGRGGMGEVFLGVQEGDDFERSVAVKLIRRGLESEEATRRFAQERRLLARLRHPNIASLLDGGTTAEGTPYVVMEFVEGVRLDQYCEARKLDERARIELMLKVCQAVQHAHRNLVIHRDLKPANILVTEQGEPKLLDFGIGKLLDPVGEHTAGVQAAGEGAVGKGSETPWLETQTGMRALTPLYAAPEQIRGEAVTTASDVFSLAVILYELVGGAHPWPELEEPHRLAAIDYGPPTRPKDTGRASGGRRMSLDLHTVLSKGLRFEPDRRYPTVDAFAEDLNRHLAGRPVTARPDTLGYRTSRFVRRNRTAVLAASLVLATVTVAGSAVVAQRAQAAERVAAERDKLRETQGFLLEMFGAVGPDESGGAEVSARALLDAQAERIAGYADRPEVQAEIQVVLADGYQRLGLVDEAYPLAMAAVETRTTLFGDEHPDVAQARSLLGWIERERGDTDAAEANLRDAIASFRASPASSERNLSKALNDLGVVLGDQSRHEEAAVVLDEALTLRRASAEALPIAIGVTANNLAASYWQLGRQDETISLLEEALDVLEQGLGPEHGRVWTVRANLLGYQSQGRTAEERVEAWRGHVRRAEELFGPAHRETVWASYLLGLSLYQARTGSEAAANLAEANRVLAEAVAVADSTFGPNHPRTASILVGQSNGFLLVRDFEASFGARARAVEIYESVFGPDHPEIGLALREMARAKLALGEEEEGDRLATEAWRHHQRVYGAGHLNTLSQQVNVARRLTATGKPGEAVELLREAATMMDELDPAQPRLAFQTRISLAQALAQTGQSAAADSVLESLRPELGDMPAGLVTAFERALEEVAEGR